MNLLWIIAFAIVFLSTSEKVNAFSLRRIALVHTLPKERSAAPNNKVTAPPIFGILDDMMMDEDSSSIGSGSSNDNSPEQQKLQESKDDDDDSLLLFESLLNDLIFSTSDTRKDIANRLDACRNPDFLQYIEYTMEESSDREEKEALQDLLTVIDQVIAQADADSELALEKEEKRAKKEQERQAQMDAQAAAAKLDAANDEAVSTTADLVKKANAIDEAIMMVAEPSEDEEPLDFMRDAKAVRGLGGFNNQGQMRVGGDSS